MKMVIKPYAALPCATKVFKINNIDADINDFGVMEDTNKPEAQPYGCACMQFIKNDDNMSDAIEKYNISEDEFRHIQLELETTMYVGRCGWCV